MVAILTNIHWEQEVNEDTSVCLSDCGEGSDKVEDCRKGEDSAGLDASVQIKDSREVGDDRWILKVVIGDPVNSIVIGS